MSALEVYTPVRVTRSVLTRPEALDVPVGRGTVETPRATVKVKEKDFFFIFNLQQIYTYNTNISGVINVFNHFSTNQ